jgi:hypothetical protein
MDIRLYVQFSFPNPKSCLGALTLSTGWIGGELGRARAAKSKMVLDSNITIENQ